MRSSRLVNILKTFSRKSWRNLKSLLNLHTFQEEEILHHSLMSLKHSILNLIRMNTRAKIFK